MALDITGKLIKLQPVQTGTGAKGTWVKQDFVIETMEQYPKKVCCSAWGDKADALKRFSLNDDIKVSFNLESREYNEKWYTDVRAWKIEPAGKSSSDQGDAKKTESSSGDPFNIASEGEDDLPF